MPTRTEHSKTLDKVKALLKRKGPLTAKQVAEDLESSKPTAYQRIRALIARGEDVYTIPAAADGTGPRPLAYGIK